MSAAKAAAMQAAGKGVEGIGGTSLMQVCPRGCGFKENARRITTVKSRRSGRADIQTRFEFETDNCPRCGARLLRECPRCDAPILAGPADRCRFCGLPNAWARERTLIRSASRRWERTARLIWNGFDSRRFYAYHGDITRMILDEGAIVSTDDTDGAMWSDVSLAIANAAGEDVERESIAAGPHEPGDAWFTEPGHLDEIKGIIHVASTTVRKVAMERQRPIVDRSVRMAMKEAYERQLSALALPAVGSGTSGLSIPVSVEVITAAVIDELSAGRTSLKTVILVLFERPDFDELVDHARSIAESSPPPATR